jgi:hypothetical protein
MNVARVTVMAMTQGLARGRHVWWNAGVAAAAARVGPFLGVQVMCEQTLKTRVKDYGLSGREDYGCAMLRG